MSRKLKINKKIIAILLLIFTLLGNVQPIFAASGNADFTGGQYD